MNREKINKLMWIAKALLIFNFVIASAFGTSTSSASPTTKVKKKPSLLSSIGVSSLVIKAKDVQATVKYPAKVIPLVHGKLTTEISGAVTRIYKHLGQKVKAGERIFALKNIKAGVHFNNYAVRAPVSGTISQLDLTVGQFITAGEIAGTVTNITKMKLIVESPAEDLSSISVGLKAVMKLHGQSIESRVTGVSPLLDATTGTARVELLPLKYVNTLILGAIGQVVIYLPSQKSIIVPPESLVAVGSKYYIRKIIKDDLVKVNEVKLGRLIDGQQVILSGLTANEEIVVRASDYLKNGDKITRQNKPTKNKM